MHTDSVHFPDKHPPAQTVQVPYFSISRADNTALSAGHTADLCSGFGWAGLPLLSVLHQRYHTDSG